MQEGLLESARSVCCTSEHQSSKIIYLDIKENVKLEDRSLCQICGKDGRGRLECIDDAIKLYYENQKKHNYALKMEQKIQEYNEKFLPLKLCLLEIREKFYSSVNAILEKINNGQNLIQQDFSKYMINENQLASLTVLRQIAEVLSINNDDNICNIQKHYKHILKPFKQLCLEFKQFTKSAEDALKKLICDKMNFEVIQIRDQKEHCGAAAFNKDGTLLATAQDNLIQLWESKQVEIRGTEKKTTEFKKLYTLKEHKMKISCLCFGNETNILVSGGWDNLLVIWQEKNKKLQILQRFQDQDYLRSILILQNDKEILASCGNLIKVWYYQEKWQEGVSLEKHSNYVYQLSKGQAGDTFGSCSYDKTIVIWKREKQAQNSIISEWKFRIQIKGQNPVYNFCIIDDSQIAVQENGCRYVKFYKITENTKNCELEDKRVELPLLNTNMDWQFPMTFNPIKQILFLRHNNNVFILRKRKNGIYYIEQKFEGQNNINGTISTNTEQIVLWNKDREKINFYENQKPPEPNKSEIKEIKQKINELEGNANTTSQTVGSLTQRQMLDSPIVHEQQQIINNNSQQQWLLKENCQEQQHKKEEKVDETKQIAVVQNQKFEKYQNSNNKSQEQSMQFQQKRERNLIDQIQLTILEKEQQEKLNIQEQEQKNKCLSNANSKEFQLSDEKPLKDQKVSNDQFANQNSKEIKNQTSQEYSDLIDIYGDQIKESF